MGVITVPVFQGSCEDQKILIVKGLAHCLAQSRRSVTTLPSESLAGPRIWGQGKTFSLVRFFICKLRFFVGRGSGAPRIIDLESGDP